MKHHIQCAKSSCQRSVTWAFSPFDPVFEMFDDRRITRSCSSHINIALGNIYKQYADPESMRVEVFRI